MARTKRLNARYEAVTSLIDLGKHDQAVEEARHVLRQFPHNGKAHQLLAWALWHQRALDEAESAIRTALTLAPQSGDVHSTLALILADQGRHQEAQHHYEQSIAVEPRVAGFYTRYARFLLKQGDVTAALRYADDALQLDPRDVDAHLIRARILGAYRRFNEAEASLREALALEPNWAWPHELLGRIHEERGNYRKALLSFREALRLSPTNEFLQNKVIDMLGDRIPLLGFLWRLFGGSLHSGCRLTWILFTTIALCGFVNTMSKPYYSFNDNYWIVFVGIIVWGLLAWFLRPLITKAVIDGWIKI